eukprot:CAMPEP_0115599246 /NCGR_PEP_ID=MMETSP0272-20121206/14292_1 /TAXON_ID=71861 /ORGANISM="Scrippsiella trochoidea, Strain CCMP3099" /LENGTH=461 /DNA_ID=CAMNT_0003034689 /DNA_START=115 /DNA_END=1501 /DNA_ORIENTATION=-
MPYEDLGIPRQADAGQKGDDGVIGVEGLEGAGEAKPRAPPGEGAEVGASPAVAPRRRADPPAAGSPNVGVASAAAPAACADGDGEPDIIHSFHSGPSLSMGSAGDAAAAGADRLKTHIFEDRILPSPAGWIDVPICEAILTKDVRILSTVDGSANSMTSLTYVTEGLLQTDKRTFAEVLHIYDDSKTYLPVSCRKEALRTTCEALLTGCVSSKRYRLKWVRKAGEGSTGDQICEGVRQLPADYICMGYFGLKGKKQNCHSILGKSLSTNVATVLSQGNSCSLICIKDESPNLLPIKLKKSTFVVSVSMNKASTKAFLDALRLSKPGDEIHVVYIKSYMENSDSDYTAEVRAKYEGFFSSFKDNDQQVFSRFHDRMAQFVLVSKQRRETTAQAIVRYADSVDADFVVVGANAADRVARGKKPVGSVSLQICLLTERNFIVANWIDVIPRVYEDVVRTAHTPV